MLIGATFTPTRWNQYQVMLQKQGDQIYRLIVLLTLIMPAIDSHKDLTLESYFTVTNRLYCGIPNDKILWKPPHLDLSSLHLKMSLNLFNHYSTNFE
jgi:hypothetical protein